MLWTRSLLHHPKTRRRGSLTRNRRHLLLGSVQLLAFAVGQFNQVSAYPTSNAVAVSESAGLISVTSKKEKVFHYPCQLQLATSFKVRHTVAKAIAQVATVLQQCQGVYLNNLRRMHSIQIASRSLNPPNILLQ
jgi:hypothetical protein